jgi:predicted acyltransferase
MSTLDNSTPAASADVAAASAHPAEAPPPPAGTSPASGRLLALDVFRGATLAAMLIANNPGDWSRKFPAFEHAHWNGCTFTDLIFPGFVFIMGVAMTFSFARRIAEGGNRGALIIQLIRRTLILIALGLALQALSYGLLHDPDSPRKFRYPGVLQRIALCYFFAGLVLLTGLRARGQAVVAAVLLIGYHFLMKYVPVPGFGAGKLGPEGGNWATFIDDRIFGAHGYLFLKETKLWHDPEGLLSTIPAIATALIGTITGYLMRDKARAPFEKVAALMAWGFAVLVVGLTWSYFFPANKNLWTSSFVMIAGGWALLGLGACYYCTDIRRVTWWTKPFVVLGTNAIFTYVTVGMFTILSIYIKWEGADGKKVALKTWLYEHLVKSWVEPALGANASSLGWGIFYIAVWTLLVGVLLYRKRIFIKV